MYTKDQKKSLRKWNRGRVNLICEIQFQHSNRINPQPQPDPFTAYIHLDSNCATGATPEFMVSDSRKDNNEIGFRWFNLFKGLEGIQKQNAQALLENLAEVANAALMVQGLPTIRVKQASFLFDFDYSNLEESVKTALAQATVVDNIFQTNYKDRISALRNTEETVEA